MGERERLTTYRKSKENALKILILINSDDNN